MPARIFASEAEMHGGIRGWRARTANAAAKHEARIAELNSPEYQERAKWGALLSEEGRLNDLVLAAEAHVTKLQGKLTSASHRAQAMSERSYATGDIHSEAAEVRRQIDGLPSLIARAEGAAAVARDDLAAHRARIEAERAAAAHVVVEVEAMPADPVAEPLEAKRGPGRPRKPA